MHSLEGVPRRARKVSLEERGKEEGREGRRGREGGKEGGDVPASVLGLASSTGLQCNRGLVAGKAAMATHEGSLPAEPAVHQDTVRDSGTWRARLGLREKSSGEGLSTD